MQIGKLPESVLARSVLQPIRHRRPEILMGPAIGQDCGIMQLAEDEVFVISTDPITGTVHDIGNYSIHITANDLAAAGAEPVGVMITALLPEETDERELRKMMQDVENTCAALEMEVMGGHTEITDVVKQPLLSVTGVGKVRQDQVLLTNQMQPGDDLVVTKWIALEGTSILAKEREAQLKQVFPVSFVRTACDFDQYLSVIPESRVATKQGVHAMHDITEGGILGALWEMAEGAGTGLDIQIKSIPIRQESIEICEQFGINPYQLMSSGSMLLATENGNAMVQALHQAGIHGTVIGRATDSHDRILRNGDEIRYLDRPKSDELYQVLAAHDGR